MPTYGTNGYIAGLTAGTEVSSTYEGRHVNLLESTLTHPYHDDGLVDKGDPVVCGNIVGVAMQSASAATDYITVDTEGIWNLTAYAEGSDGSADGYNVAIAVGDLLYIDTTALGKGIGTLSKQSDPGSNKPFGVALGAVSSGSSGVIAIKVHNDFSSPFAFIGTGTAAAGQVAITAAQPALLKVFANHSGLTGQRHVANFRIAADTTNTTGELTCAEFKVINNQTGQLTGMTPLKIDIDNKTSAGGSTLASGIQIKAEGAGTAIADLAAIEFQQSGTAGTKEALFKLESATVFGGKASDTLTTPSGTIAVNVGGTVQYLQLYTT